MSKATPLGNATKMAGAHRLTHSQNLVRQLSAITKRMPGLASKATPLGDATKMAVAFVAGAHRLTHSRNLVWQLPAIAEYMLGLASKATPLSEAAKTAHVFVARHVRSHADSLKVCASCGNYLSSLR